MRFLMLIVLVPLLFGLMFFTVSNANTTVSVALPWNTYPTVSLLTVVSYSIGLGVVVTAILAVFEGAAIRLNNRRLRREILKLETEVNYLRTQPRVTTIEPDDAATALPPLPVRTSTIDEKDVEPAAAPVYKSRSDDRSGH